MHPAPPSHHRTLTTPRLRLHDSWAEATATSTDGETYQHNTKNGASVSLTFTGTSIQWTTATGPAFGMARVVIDGVNEGTLDLCSSTLKWAVGESYGGFSPGTHTIVITGLGKKDPASSRDEVVVEGFVASG
jgi:hypothetical protein